MVRLEILGGIKARGPFIAARFPIRVGRSPGADLSLDDPGVWPEHFTIERQTDDLLLQAGPEALLTLNGQTVQQAPLRNGDVIGAGALKIQFTLTPVRQRSAALREALTWIGLAALCGAQVAVVYWLSQL